MTIKQAIEQIDNRAQEIPSNWHAGKGLGDGVTWAEVREWLASLLTLSCNCGDPADDLYGHLGRCDVNRPESMSEAEWKSIMSDPPLPVHEVIMTGLGFQEAIREARAEGFHIADRKAKNPFGEVPNR